MSHAPNGETLRAKISLFVREFGPRSIPSEIAYSTARTRLLHYHLPEGSITANWVNGATINVIAPGVALGASRNEAGQLTLESEEVNRFVTPNVKVQKLYGPSYTEKQRTQDGGIIALDDMRNFAQRGLSSPALARSVRTDLMTYVTSEGDKWKQVGVLPYQAAPNSMWKVKLYDFPRLTISVTFNQDPAFVPSTRAS